MLSSKAKEDFETWLEQYHEVFYRSGFHFTDLPQSMQSGVLLEFFDSVGIYIEIEVNLKPISYTSRVLNDRGYYYHYTLETREEALKEAFKKAEEIYNN